MVIHFIIYWYVPPPLFSTHIYIYLHIRAHTHNTLTYNMYRYFSCYFQTGISFYTQKKALLFLLQTFLFGIVMLFFGVVGLFNYLLKTRNVVVVVVY